MSSFVKDPGAVLDYTFDFAVETNGTGDGSDWLTVGEIISSHTIVVDDGITVGSSSETLGGKAVEVWLSGGVVGDSYNVTCSITTSLGRVDQRSMQIDIHNR